MRHQARVARGRLPNGRYRVGWLLGADARDPGSMSDWNR